MIVASAETFTTAALAELSPIKVYPDVAPAGAIAPYIVYQAVGGKAISTLDNDSDDLQNCRMQLAVWSPIKGESVTVMQAVRKAMMAAGGIPIGAPVSEYEAGTKMYGRRLDFSIWYRE
ncbi:hypothetical protein WL30_27525 [Burkholderia ubonensis]|nr:hypothetical protein WJ51_26250 [Burkholderia ubonensis]KVM09636.1 hypothetical protein WJ52_23550 [Burkholderia ubonensis]KVM53176.1 hypothetical protein WJ56_09305 [Burkholderia ubonensis]KWA81333.1 hypothetical protein WL30_27525 [Burkholderia ubonensis]KWB13237.1 hypothetical protein WL31_18755 [Burkholderia ubonensis]